LLGNLAWRNHLGNKMAAGKMFKKIVAHSLSSAIVTRSQFESFGLQNRTKGLGG